MQLRSEQNRPMSLLLTPISHKRQAGTDPRRLRSLVVRLGSIWSRMASPARQTPRGAKLQGLQISAWWVLAPFVPPKLLTICRDVVGSSVALLTGPSGSRPPPPQSPCQPKNVLGAPQPMNPSALRRKGRCGPPTKWEPPTSSGVVQAPRFLAASPSLPEHK